MTRGRTLVKTRYAQTDFDVTSRRSLVSLRAALVKHGLVEVNSFRRGSLWCAGFEGPRPHDTSEQCVRAILDVLDGLDATTRALLRACSKRDVDIAFDVGRDDRFTSGLSRATIKRLAHHDVGVRVTLYRAVP